MSVPFLSVKGLSIALCPELFGQPDDSQAFYFDDFDNNGLDPLADVDVDADPLNVLLRCEEEGVPLDILLGEVGVSFRADHLEVEEWVREWYPQYFRHGSCGNQDDPDDYTFNPWAEDSPRVAGMRSHSRSTNVERRVGRFKVKRIIRETGNPALDAPLRRHGRLDSTRIVFICFNDSHGWRGRKHAGDTHKACKGARLW